MKLPRPAFLPLLALLGACSAIPDADNRPEAARAPAKTPAPAPVVVTEPVPAPPAEFSIGGEAIQGGWLRGTAPFGTKTLTLDGDPIPFAADGAFFAAFDRDAGASATLAARLANGRVITRKLAVAPRDWNIEHVNIARSPGGATEAFMKIRRPELAQIAAARAVRSDTGGWRQDFIWPVQGRISGRFGSQRIYKGGEAGSYHSGIDIATGESGTPIVAPADGVVVLAAQTPFSLEGNLLMIDHGMGLNSAFLHCSEITVKLGDHVKQGQMIARIGMSGRATGPHLHWSLKWLDSRLDPLLFTGPMR